ncbi:PQQ-dependent dehydrogenase, methanol/ethanol family [Novosphingobium sp. TH158]|uniref:PQQ-dependent dehydrogenase, methanol/ethanol family n=1 Tax=Novosphingobium sp. TH158 TaxID=2067455 RepID=UPI000C7B12AD|nr:PQQ-dependent dehydrogenase, methanol/ethanol family [Novosphingobium sp. TH158]PLK25740.1 PQQ-dependent dehydrogenase, methanol/ethanol family [Novosphingobium sp. TH158]
MRARAWIAALAAALFVAGCAPQPTGPAREGITDAMLANPPEGEWLSYGRDLAEQRFSPLTQITDANVGDLGLAWSLDLETARGQEATPLMHDGTLYVSTAWSIVKAVDARTGRLKWSYDLKVPRETLARACCDAVNRGVALYGTNLYVATLDGRLVALDRATGGLKWSALVVPNMKDYTITGAPRIANGLVLIGSGGAEFKARGFIAAYDHNTGQQIWRFHTVPGDPAKGHESEAMEKAARTWSGKWWELGGGGTVWDSITYDPRTNLVLFGTGNAEPWNPAAAGREGDSLYTSSIVAVHADTGKYAWHFQETPEDRWDYDSNAQIILADMEIGGRMRHVALHAPKNGYFYVLDAATGEFLSAGPFVPQNWTTGIDPKTGRPAINPEARYEKTGKPFVGLPGVAGAHSWQPMSYSPKTGLVYLPANLTGFPYAAAKDWKASEVGFQVGLDSAVVAMPADPRVRAGALAATTGALIAWDPRLQKAAWTVPQTGPWNGGTLATAGNLVFQGDAAGNFSAYSADKGGRLWSFPVQTGVMAAPMTYALDGEQYVAVLVGWGGMWDATMGTLAHKSGAVRNISRLLVFKLGAKGQLPAPKPLNRLPLDPPAFTGTAQQVASGAAHYARYCAVCHGDAAVAGGINPDLRRSGVLNDAAIMKAVVIDGALSPRNGGNGMVAFGKVLKPADAEAIRQYLIKRANEDRALGER